MCDGALPVEVSVFMFSLFGHYFVLLNHIWTHSPEMIPDGTKDYSVYVLDPLEDIQSKARYGSSAVNSRGVAVGMGLLSTVLNPHFQSTLQVTGTIIGCDTDDAALEVVISLRQVSIPIV